MTDLETHFSLEILIHPGDGGGEGELRDGVPGPPQHPRDQPGGADHRDRAIVQ